MYNLLIGLVFLLVTTAVKAGTWATGPHIRVDLLAENQSFTTASENWIGVYLQPESQWHTYWLNPGDSGEAPQVKWTAFINGEPDEGGQVQFGEIHWPVPERIPVAHLVNFGYSEAHLLMLPVAVAQTTKPGDKIQIQAELSWLVCKEDCIPGWATLTIERVVSEQQIATPEQLLFQSTRQQWPADTTLSAQYELTEQHLTVAMPEQVSRLQNALFLFPERSDLIKHNAVQQRIEIDGTSAFVLEKSEYFSGSNEPVRLLVSDGKQGYWLSAKLNTAAQFSSNSNSNSSLLLMVIFAFTGGLILNLMPCVLPVLAIKGLSLTNQSEGRSVKFAYMLGVICSFLLFALLILAVKQAGQNIGWGFHMQEPLVLMALCLLFTYIILMLLDIAPGTEALMGVGQNLTAKNQFQHHFLTGVLAVLVASPCTAPFMGVAMGAAMVSPPLHTVLIFFSLGFGFALPMTLLHMFPALARLLPKPGIWMETFKQFLVFPMLGTLIWLLWVFSGQAGNQAQLLLSTCLVLFALTFWAKTKGIISLYIVCGLLSGALFWFAQPKSEFSETHGVDIAATWSEQRLAQLRNNNQVVLVNMTADWCITCKVNEQVAFEYETVRQLLAQQDVHYLVGDWTNKNDEILQYLNRYQRVGVPLYVLYAGREFKRVLPQILTPQILKSAIVEAQEAL
ncbi:protein-disulfide reductase DsbD family protein [Planctobacterium marinum]|uniref:Thiol:disulfide interchange protein n=1 Tax=Planctobacterium marinum TaxID=1631968 RepID=A0AA48KPX2_9ALTE|nr:thiol:disulfide interchange protein [Planctobacterium marinum]